MKIYSTCSECFAGMACQARIEIYNLLKEKGETNVMEIVKAFQLTQPTVTHHLKYLEEVGILRSVKRGRKVYYSIHPKCSKKVCNLF